MSKVHRKTDAATTLLWSPQYTRLTETLQDLIIIAYERLTNTHGKSLRLVRFEYVSAENSGGKCYMLLNVLVKELEANVTVPLQLTFTVNSGDEYDS